MYPRHASRNNRVIKAMPVTQAQRPIMTLNPIWTENIHIGTMRMPYKINRKCPANNLVIVTVDKATVHQLLKKPMHSRLSIFMHCCTHAAKPVLLCNNTERGLLKDAFLTADKYLDPVGRPGTSEVRLPQT